MRNIIPAIFVATLLLAGCGPGPITPTPTATDAVAAPTSQPPTATVAAATDIVPSATIPASSSTQFIAYVYDGELLVTDITNGVIGGTTQYTAAGASDKVTDLAWSPSGDFVAFVSAASGNPHVMYIYARGASTPTDLGPGSAPAWSPDSRSIAYVGGSYPDENIFETAIDNPAPQQLTSESNHAWGRPAFTPDGTALIVSTADRNDMGAQGNTSFTLERLALDGSGTRTALPGASSVDGARLPYDLRFSPDGTRLAFSTSSHLSACASPGAYYVSNADGANSQELVSQSLQAAIDTNHERYFEGLSYGWAPQSDALIASGTVVDCDFNSPTMGQAVAGPQLSVLRLDGSEGIIIPGMFYSPSVDRTGKMIAAAHYKDLQDQNPMVEVYSLETGQLLLTVGPGNSPALQP